MRTNLLSVVLILILCDCSSRTVIVNDKSKDAIAAGDSIYYPTYYKSILAWKDSMEVIKKNKPSKMILRNEKDEILDPTQIPPDFVPVDLAPRPVKIATPIYPKEAFANKLNGEVWIKMWVDENGSVLFAKIMKSSDNIFNEQSLVAAINSKFQPAVIDKKPFAVWVSMPFRFKLNR